MTSPPTFWWLNIKDILLGKNQPAKFDKTDYQTISSTYFSFYLALSFHGHTKRPYSRSWSKTSAGSILLTYLLTQYFFEVDEQWN